jgi:hypothetical protein
MAQLMDEASDGVRLVTGTDVNWILVADGDEVTSADTGEPLDVPGAWCRSRPPAIPADTPPFTSPSAACSSPAMR